MQHLSVRNATRAATAWAASPVGRLVRVEVLVTLSCAVLAVLVFLGSGRRARRSAAFHLVVWSALMLCYPAVSYTIGLMQSACSFRNELTVTWGCFLLLLLGCADGVAAFSLNDSDQQMRTMLNQALQIVYVFFLLLPNVSSLPWQLRVLWALSAVKLGLRIRSLVLAGRARVLTDDNKLIADYMLHEHEVAGADYDAAKMTGYNYVVTGETNIDDGEDDLLSKVREGCVVTIDTVWNCDGRLLSSDDEAARRRKDLCLSFALFKLLRRRLGGYPLHESRLSKTRDFVKLGLLNAPAAGSVAEGDHERMYRVIEVELGFLFDLYYTRYPSPKETLILDTVVFAAVVATSLSTLFCSKLLDYHAGDSNATATTWFDIWLTRGIIVLFLTMESFQYFTLVFSDWHKVKMLCRYVRKRSWRNHPIVDVLLRFMSRVTLTRYWNNSVGQYNLLHATFRQKNSWISSILLLPKWARDALVQSTMTDHRTLTAKVKREIHRFLGSGGLTRLRYGECALEQNGMLHKLSSKSVAHGGTAHGILTWHIATTMCDLRPGEASADDNREVAVMLSDYCAYLMSSAPELLPGHSHGTKLVFNGVQQCAKKRLQDCRTKDDIYGELAKLRPGKLASPDLVSAEGARHKMSSHDVILAEGAELGRRILQLVPDGTARWKVLAELWVEMLLSVAPSDNVTGHVQRLATGGELVTHLWALLTHAGVVESRYQRGGT